MFLTVLLRRRRSGELAANVGRLLEVLSELTRSLELIIVTTARPTRRSRWATSSPAGIRRSRNSQSVGFPWSLARASGDFTRHAATSSLLDDDRLLPSGMRIRGLFWRAAKEHEIGVLGRVPAVASDSIRFRESTRRAGRVPHAQPPRRLPFGIVSAPATLRRGNSPAPAPVDESRSAPHRHTTALSTNCPPRSPELLRASRDSRSASNANAGGDPLSGWASGLDLVPISPAFSRSQRATWNARRSADPPPLVPTLRLGNGRSADTQHLVPNTSGLGTGARQTPTPLPSSGLGTGRSAESSRPNSCTPAFPFGYYFNPEGCRPPFGSVSSDGWMAVHSPLLVAISETEQVTYRNVHTWVFYRQKAL